MRHAPAALLLAALAAAQQAPPPATTPPVEPDLAYADADPAQRLDLYLPAKAAQPFTTVLFVYGGGWHGGNYKNLAGVATNLQAHGFACALVNHRLSPPHQWPAMIEDVAAAFAWLRARVIKAGGDGSRIVVAGHSSGAQLVLLLASEPKWLAAHDCKPEAIAGVLGLSTPVDLRPSADGKGRGFGDALMGGRGADVFGREAQVMAAASPCTQLGKQLPPCVLVVGENDFPSLLEDARAYAKAAQVLGHRVPVLVAKGHQHGSVPRVLLAGEDPLQAQLLRFLAAPARFVPDAEQQTPAGAVPAAKDGGK